MADPSGQPEPSAPPPLRARWREVVFDPHGNVNEDILCRRCGYNLRGLHSDGTCPECMTGVGDSLHADLLRFGDPRWVRELSRGVTLLLISTLGGIVIGVAWVTTASAIMGMGGTVVLRAALGGVALLSLALACVAGLAYWKVTTPEPGATQPGGSPASRRIARTALLAGLVLDALTSASDPDVYDLFVDTTISIPGLAAVSWGLGCAGSAVGLTGLIAMLLYARSIAGRIPDDKLAARTGVVMWGCAVSIGLLLAVLIAADLFWRADAGDSWVIGTAYAVTGVSGAVFGIWGIILLFQYRRRLRDASHLARACSLRAEGWSEG